MPEPAAARPRASRRWAPLGWVLAVGGLSLGAAMVPWRGECGFLYVLGAPCPGCGMTRALGALAAGDPGTAFRFHPLAFPLALAAILVVGLAIHEGTTGRPTLRGAAERWALPATVAGLALLAAVWAARVLWRPEWSPDPIRPGSVAGRILRR